MIREGLGERSVPRTLREAREIANTRTFFRGIAKLDADEKNELWKLITGWDKKTDKPEALK